MSIFARPAQRASRRQLSSAFSPVPFRRRWRVPEGPCRMICVLEGGQIQWQTKGSVGALSPLIMLISLTNKRRNKSFGLCWKAKLRVHKVAHRRAGNLFPHPFAEGCERRAENTAISALCTACFRFFRRFQIGLVHFFFTDRVHLAVADNKWFPTPLRGVSAPRYLGSRR